LSAQTTVSFDVSMAGTPEGAGELVDAVVGVGPTGSLAVGAEPAGVCVPVIPDGCPTGELSVPRPPAEGLGGLVGFSEPLQADETVDVTVTVTSLDLALEHPAAMTMAPDTNRATVAPTAGRLTTST